MPNRPKLLSLLFLIASISLAASAAHAQGSCAAPAPQAQLYRGASHVLDCTPLTLPDYPPSSGNHYQDWADFLTYPNPVPAGFLIHSQEHGAVIFWYRCPPASPCPDQVKTLQAIADAYPADSLCNGTNAKHRIIIVPDTLMDARFAATAWGWSLKSDCLDSAAFSAFLAAHYGQGPELLCYEDLDMSKSAQGWCPGAGKLEGIRDAGHAGLDTRADGMAWKGSLERPGRLRMEILSVNGARLAEYDLGAFAAGPADVAWDAGDFRKSHPSAGTVACRLRFLASDGSSRTLWESALAP